MRKLFVIKKYVMANSAKEAIKKEKEIPVDDVWIDEDFRRNMMPIEIQKEMGFKKNTGT